MKINFGESSLIKTTIHLIGKRNLDEGIVSPSAEIDLKSSNLESTLLTYFLSSINKQELYTFTHDHDLKQNEILQISKELFLGRENFQVSSKKIAGHLYSCSSHPNIKPGELYVAYFKDILIDDELVDGIGIFKSEIKDQYIKVDNIETDINIRKEEGSNMKSMDKGSLILNQEGSEGLIVLNVSSPSKKSEAKYWNEDFLEVIPISNSYFATTNLLKMSKDFVKKSLGDRQKTEQIEILNRSVNYFKENKDYDERDFINHLSPDQEIRESFEEFTSNYKDTHSLNSLKSNFEISEAAVKKVGKSIKSSIVLDKNIFLNFKGAENRIEKGYDSEKKLNYYKIYFDEEL